MGSAGLSLRSGKVRQLNIAMTICATLLQETGRYLLVSAPLHVCRQVERPYCFRAHGGHCRRHVGTARQPQALLREQHALQAHIAWQSSWVPEQTALGSSLPSIGTTEVAGYPAGTDGCRADEPGP